MLPALFLSHGAPNLPLTDAPARTFLAGLGAELGRPRAILVVSAHWETATPQVNAVAVNDTIHDFYGFPRALYALRYDAPGDADLAARIAQDLTRAGLAAGLDRRRGLDHGAWVPLLLMYPAGDIPVLQLSIQSHLGSEHHLRLGAALRGLRRDGVLVVASGSFTHDLSEFRGQAIDGPEPAWVSDFADWMDQALTEQRMDDLLDYRRLAPFAAKNHPTEEHLLPLYVALGAGTEGGEVRRLHRSATYGVLRMDAYAVD
ncbi:MAG: hypothetical protein RLY86_3939 [Pseudomonadota bacterium]|jgi:4,5-DOPA dioxygenase extradiol